MMILRVKIGSLVSHLLLMVTPVTSTVIMVIVTAVRLCSGSIPSYNQT